MANTVLHTATYVNPAGTRFRLRKVEGYGWELHSMDADDKLVDFYGGFDKMGHAQAYADTGKALKPA